MDGRPDTLQGILPGLFHLGYPLPRQGWDEMSLPDGTPRPHWAPLIDLLARLAPNDVEARRERAQRLIRDNGITYNVYGDPGELHRPWDLDPIPVLMDVAEWRKIEEGLVQRAHLLNHLLGDIYGPQHLLSSGALSPVLVFSNPGYQRPLRGANPVGGMHLHVYAADLARGPDGAWWVLRDRVESPAGAGYALENRIIVSRILPEPFRASRVERLAPFFQKLRESLIKLAPRGRENPRIVLLTPGPYNETYFEHAYLARYLGYTLAENEDLTVRNERVFLKTLDGLLPVDVILRRTDSAFCDPLELRSDSALGVAGLVQAVHAGTVTVVNALGSGVVESGGLRPFLPELCRRILGEDLKLPSVATWWCGQPRERRYVLENFDRLLIKSCVDTRSGHSLTGGEMAADARAALMDDLQRRPYRYIGQEVLDPSNAPSWQNGRLEPRRLVMRVYVVWTGDGYAVMPGGLSRSSDTPRVTELVLQNGGNAKDTWIIADRPVPPFTLLRGAAMPARGARGGRDLPSRVADNLYWLGRHTERCEGTARMLRAAITRALEVPETGGGEELATLLALLAELGRLPEAEKDETPTLEDTVRALVRANFTPGQGIGLRPSMDWLQQVSMVIRDRLSMDTWRAINRLQGEIGALNPEGDLGETQHQLNEVILTLEALSGLAQENMTRGLGWRFLDIGRRLERALHAIDLLGAALRTDRAVGETDLGSGETHEVLLEIADSIMTYRARYLTLPSMAAVLDLLMSDESNPRALSFQLVRLAEHMDHLAGDRSPGDFTQEQRLMIRMLSDVRTIDLDWLAGRGQRRMHDGLGALLESFRARLYTLSEGLTRRYFAHAAEKRSNPAAPSPASQESQAPESLSLALRVERAE